MRYILTNYPHSICIHIIYNWWCNVVFLHHAKVPWCPHSWVLIGLELPYFHSRAYLYQTSIEDLRQEILCRMLVISVIWIDRSNDIPHTLHLKYSSPVHWNWFYTRTYILEQWEHTWTLKNYDSYISKLLMLFSYGTCSVAGKDNKWKTSELAQGRFSFPRCKTHFVFATLSHHEAAFLIVFLYR